MRERKERGEIKIEKKKKKREGESKRRPHVFIRRNAALESES